MERYDVAVIGLGMVGASAVYAAAGAGARVLALDVGPPGGGTSGTSFAWLNSVRKEPDVYHRLNAAGMTARRELASKLEPGLAIPHRVQEIAFFAADAWLDAPRLIGRLLAAAAARGADVRKGATVRSLRSRGSRVEAAVGDDTEMVAQSFLVCVGPATQAFLDPLRVVIPVGRVPGFLAVTSRPAQPLHRVVHAPGIHLRPDAGGGLLLGAEDVDSLAANAGPPALGEAAALLLERATRVFPSAGRVKVVDTRLGVRPMPADHHTIAGRIPGFANAWMIATHSGVTLGPLLGRLLADEIVRGVPSSTLVPFRPERFTTA